MDELRIPLNGGLVTSRDPADLEPGEMVQSTGVYLKPGDTGRVHVLPTRAEFNDITAETKIKGLALCQFDSGGTDKLVAMAGTTLYGATPGITGTFAKLQEAGADVVLDTNSTTMSVAHMEDRWYIANGYDRMRVLESDGTVRPAGMREPKMQPALTAITAASTGGTARPNTSTSTWTDALKAYDASTGYLETFAYTSRSTVGSTTETWSGFTSTPPTFDNPTLYVDWRLAGYNTTNLDGEGGGVGGIGGNTTSSYTVECALEVSTNGGALFTEFARVRRTQAHGGTVQASVVLTGTITTASVQVRAGLAYFNGSRVATMRVNDIRLVDTATGGSGATFTPSEGIYYAYTEFDSVRKLESAMSPQSVKFTTATRAISMTLPGTRENAITTHMRIYRTVNGGTPPQDFGYIATVPYTQTSFVDDFVSFPYNVQTFPLLRMQEISFQRIGKQYYDMDTDPPPLSHVNSYRGSLVGLDPAFPRSLRYSEAGNAESWPVLNIIAKFPLEERDELIATATVGDILLIGAKGAMMTLNDLPRVVDGVFNMTEASPLRGQPGLVAAKALCAFSVAGEARAAWVSPYGVHETNTVNSRRISSDLDWSSLAASVDLSRAVLHWNPEKLILKLVVDGDSDDANDTVYLFHMAPEHQKSNGMPKVTKVLTAPINCLAGGLVSGTYRQYSGHVSDGKVYVEEYSGAESITLQTSRVYGKSNWWGIYKANLRHTDGGANTCSVAWSMVDDANAETQTRTNATVSLSGAQGTEFYVGYSGEYAQVLITSTPSSSFSIFDIRAQVEGMGKVGRVA